jgi:hypothetical protein
VCKKTLKTLSEASEAAGSRATVGLLEQTLYLHACSLYLLTLILKNEVACIAETSIMLPTYIGCKLLRAESKSAIILSCIGVGVTNNKGFWIWWLGLLASLYNYSRL